MKYCLLLTILSVSLSPIYALDFKGMVDPNTLTNHHEKLGITKAQRTELTELVESAKSEAAILEATIRRERDLLESMVDDSEADLEKAAAQLQTLLDAESKFKRLQFKTLFVLRSKLNPEQIEKALVLQRRDQQEAGSSLEAGIKLKANRLRTAYEQIGLNVPALKERGSAINTLIRDHNWVAANEALDTLIIDTQLDEVVEEIEIDFTNEDPGETDSNILKARLESIEASAREVISIPVLHQLVHAKAALELAKENQDADTFGRVLTWAENLLAQE